MKEKSIGHQEDEGIKQDETVSKTQLKQRLTPLQQRMRKRLHGSTFRAINESLYQNESAASLHMFQNHPETFALYHAGYREQVATWPVNPTEVCVRYLQRWVGRVLGELKRDRTHPKRRELTIVDMGAGEGLIAAALDSRVRSSWSARKAIGICVLVHSFDLISVNERVVACDMAKGVELASNTADVVVFCLSLMGLNYAQCVEEGVRLLRRQQHGPNARYSGSSRLVIVEVSSRFHESESNKDPSRVENAFVRGIESHGLRLIRRRRFTDYFLFFEFAPDQRMNLDHHDNDDDEDSNHQGRLTLPPLKACVYKRR